MAERGRELVLRVGLSLLLSSLSGCTGLKPNKQIDMVEGNTSGAGGAGAGGGAGSAGQAGAAGSTSGASGSGASGSSGSSDGGRAVDQGDAGPNQSCEEGAMRCASGAVAEREVCIGGGWTAGTPCAEGQVCDTGNVDAPGTCADAAEFCVGSAGMRVCKGAVMHECNDLALSVSQQACASERHCLLGLEAGACAVCIPGEEYRCEGTALEVCNASGSGFEPFETCATAALCNAEAGACTDEACVEGSYTCTDDMLRRCNADRTGFEDVQPCEPGMCDAANGQCDVCTPGVRSCMNGGPATCNAQGQGYDTATCMAPRSRCTGVGVCVECTTNAHCTQTPPACQQFTCNIGTGDCQTRIVPGMNCQLSGGLPGVCTNQGDCVQCVSDNDCGGSTPYCNRTTNQCVECLDAGDCSTSQPCRVAACNSNRCDTAVSPGAACPGGVCNAAGACVACLNDTHCTNAGAQHCRTSTNQCVECTQNSHCPTNFNCQNNECAWVERCGNGFGEGDEQCDDGNSNDDDLCDNQCRSTIYRACTHETAEQDCRGNGICGSPSGRDAPLTCAPGCLGGDYCEGLPGRPEFQGICVVMVCFIECRADRSCPPGFRCVNFSAGDTTYNICEID